MSQSSIQQGLRAAQAAAPTPPPTLVFLPSGDVRCGWCGRGADPGEDSHAAHDFRDRPGCGVTWTHVVGIGEAAVEQARRSRPDLTCLDPNIQGRACDQAVTASHLHAEVERLRAENARLRAELERLAYTDPLTGLPNRRALEAELAARQASGQPYTVCAVDVDRLKAINDRHGHAAGDDAIVAVGDRLNEAAEAYGGLAARLGGDEFVVVGGPGIDAAALTKFVDPLDDTFGITVSVGVCHAGPDDDWRRALKAADVVLYRAKALRRGNQSVTVTFDRSAPLPAVPARPGWRVRDERPQATTGGEAL